MNKSAGVFWIMVMSFSVLPGWSFLQRPNRDVESGNGMLAQGKSEDALDAYDRASKSLGRIPELSYNRALALMGAGKPEEAVKEFMEASTKGDSALRLKARYNLGNAYTKMSRTKVEEGNKKVLEASELFQKAREAGLERDGEPPQEACEILRQAAATYKEAAEKHVAARSLLEKSVGEYRNVLLRQSSHFRAKWNLELAVRGMEVADSVKEEAARVAALYAERCEQDKQDKQDDQDQQDKKDKQDDQDQQDKQDKQDDQDQQDKQDKQDDQDQQDKQDKQDQKEDKQQDQQDQQEQPYDPKEERRREAERALDRLERQQREQRREIQKSQMPAGRPPVMDW